MTLLRKLGSHLPMYILPVLAVTVATVFVLKHPLGDPRSFWHATQDDDPVKGAAVALLTSNITVLVPPKTTLPGYAPGTWEASAAAYVRRSLSVPPKPLKRQRRTVVALQSTGK